MGLTDAGYSRRTYDDILNAKIRKAKALFGEDIDTSDLTPLGKYIRINAYDQALIEEELELVYYSRSPKTANGQSLDRLLVFAGLTRNAAEPAYYVVKAKGTVGHVIPSGFLVGTDTDLKFYVTEDTTVGEDGTCDLVVCCTEAGTIGNVSPSAINKVVNPDANVSLIEGTSCVIVGKNEESDADLRVRFDNAIAGAGSCNINAIRAALLRIPTVQYAAVIENEGDVADSDGRPPHSFECYVLGGSGYEQEIAETIFEKRPIGIKTHGTESVTVLDVSGREQTVKFSTALNIGVHVRVKLKVDNTFGSNGAAEVQTNVAAYINSLGISKSLVQSSIYGHVYSVTGVVEVTSLELSTDGGSTFSTANVDVPEYGVAVCQGVTVEVVT